MNFACNDTCFASPAGRSCSRAAHRAACGVSSP